MCSSWGSSRPTWGISSCASFAAQCSTRVSEHAVLDTTISLIRLSCVCRITKLYTIDDWCELMIHLCSDCSAGTSPFSTVEGLHHELQPSDFICQCLTPLHVVIFVHQENQENLCFWTLFLIISQILSDPSRGHAAFHWLRASLGFCLHGRVHCECPLAWDFLLPGTRNIRNSSQVVGRERNIAWIWLDTLDST